MPASYNPRVIDELGKSRLRESLRELGAIKPIVVRPNGTIIAGHQRTQAAAANGLKHLPAHVIDVKGQADEIRFNQLHNGCEVDLSDHLVRVPPGAPDTWVAVPSREVSAPDHLQAGAGERHEMLKLLAKYGPFSGSIATPDGEIIAGAQYAWCARQIGIPVHVRYVPARHAQLVKEVFSQTYGEYCYDNLPKTTWGQAVVQMHRLVGPRSLGSSLYDKVVIPRLAPGMRVLDFGAGQKAYVKKLSAEGVQILGVEFYKRKGNTVDIAGGHADISALVAELRKNGLFDFVVCDSVLNSVDSMQAEADVLATLNALCKLGGLIAFSGRPIYQVERFAARKQKAEDIRTVEFLDQNGFSAIFRAGIWQYQKFHRRAEVEALAKAYIGEEFTLTCGNEAHRPRADLTGSSWQVIGKKTAAPEWEAAVAREFDLPTPQGRYGRSQEVLDAIKAACASA